MKVAVLNSTVSRNLQLLIRDTEWSSGHCRDTARSSHGMGNAHVEKLLESFGAFTESTEEKVGTTEIGLQGGRRAC